MTTPSQPSAKSSCHNKPIIVRKEGTTYWWTCSACGEPCNLASAEDSKTRLTEPGVPITKAPLSSAVQSSAICDQFAKMKVIKDEKECTPEYLERLRQYLRQNAGAFFNDKNNKACAWNDFEYFNKTTDREHLCLPNEVMLIDREWRGKHSYVICRISASKTKQKAKDLVQVIEISELKYGDWCNGYFLLPRI